MLKGHGGEIYAIAFELGISPEKIIDFSSNLSPFPPPEGLYELLREHLTEIENLPEVDSFSLREAFAQKYPFLEAEQIFPSSGTTEWIFNIPRLLEPKRVFILGPTYSDYADAAKLAKVPFFYLIAEEKENFHPKITELKKQLKKEDLVFICNPNNPTGAFIEPKDLFSLIKENSEIFFVIDESYIDFVSDNASLLALNELPSNTIILRSFSKIFHIPGLRLGFAITGKRFSKLFWKHYLPWSVNRLAQIAGLWLLRQNKYVKEVRNFIIIEKERIFDQIKEIKNIKIFPTRSNFILAKSLKDKSKNIWKTLLHKYHILIRDASNFYGLNEFFFRFSLRKKTENNFLINALKEVMK